MKYFSTPSSLSKKELLQKISLLFFCSFVINHAHAQFQWLNPKPSGYSNKKIEFINPQTGFIFNTNGDLFKTIDRGNSWQFFKNFPNGVCMDIKDSTVVIGGYSGTLYVSSDNGINWLQSNTGINEVFQSVDVVSRDTFFLSNNLYGNIFKTTDRGKTFTTLHSPLPVQAMEFIDSKTGYTGGATSTIYKTQDGGISWQKKYEASSFISSIQFVTKDTGFASDDFGNLLVTNNAGNTWKSYNAGSRLYTIDFINGKDGYLGGEVGALYATHNGGKTFSDISFDARDGNSIYSMYFFSRDTGFTVGELGRIMKTTDAGKTWTAYSPTYFPITAVSFGTASIGYATNWNSILKTTDKGQTWNFLSLTTGINPPSQSRFEKANFTGKDTGFVTASNPVKVYQTFDGGNTWKTINPAPETYDNVSDMHFINAKTGFMTLRTYNSACIVKTRDGGSSWSQIWKSNINGEYFDQIYYINEATGYATRYFQLFKTTDSSKTWAPIYTSPYGYQLSDVWFVSPKRGFVSYLGSMVFTNDSGKTWASAQVSTIGNINTFKFYDPSVGYLTSDNQFGPNNYGYIYQTIDSGATWQLKIDVSGNSIQFTPDTAVIVAGFGGNILRSDIRELRIDSLSTKASPPCTNVFTAVVTAVLSKADSIAFEFTKTDNTVIVIPAIPGSVQNGKFTCTTKDSTKLENGDYKVRLKCFYDGQYRYSEQVSFTVNGRPNMPVITRTNNTLYSSYQSGNQWYRNDTLIVGATQNSYTITMPVKYTQCYTVKETVSGGCITISDKLCVNDIILPVTLLQLKAVPTNNTVLVTWQTKSEINSNYFIVESSTDGINFNAKGKVYAKSYSNIPTTYSFIDPLNAGAKTIYYRLKSVDKDESFMYSNIVTVNIPILQNSNALIIAPNPANTNTTIFFNRALTVANVTVFDAQGKKIYSARIKNELLTSYNLNTSQFRTGLYLVNITTGNETFAGRFIVIR